MHTDSIPSNFSFDDYPNTCFHYIHQNPVRIVLAARMEDWEMSSFQEYAGIKENQYVTTSLASKFLNISDDQEMFILESNNLFKLMRLY